ncbi:hypothetical protein P8625_00395 [Tenacibaculum tangerinum]|uniref:Uncharacterized protein n=1 Tax=Tenacibaculum tangerinum TaxID=3038772 RepID=A0ABY8L2I5_9FLAO|nr:hypothetical protein [Tenacibaculum tangerinum]WGH75656.1 hypothetical protein P8625_00395 [Tenacibaculum tangerinum]
MENIRSFKWAKEGITPIVTFVIALVAFEISFIHCILISLCIFCFMFLLDYKWNYKNIDESISEQNANSKKGVKTSRYIFMSLFLLLPLIIFSLYLSKKYYPEWQDEYVAYHFTTEDELKELRNKEESRYFQIDSTKHFSKIKTENPFVVIKLKKETKANAFSLNFMTYELIRYLLKDVANTSWIIFLICLGFSVVLLFVDLVAQKRLINE